MSIPVLEVVVDGRLLQGFKRRALAHYPNEYIENLWGYVKNGVAFLCAFTNVEHTARPRSIEDLPDDVEALEGLRLLGTIHTHTNHTQAFPSVTDWLDAHKEAELLTAVCAVRKTSKRHFYSFSFWKDFEQIPYTIGEPHVARKAD